jgi:hypothetical protein
MLFSGKLPQQSVEAATGCLNASGRLFVVDRHSRTKFLVDTGSDVSCFPKRYIKFKRLPTNYSLSAANNSEIKTYGTIPLTLDLGLRRNFPWSLVVADVTTPILGSDFLSHYHLLPDCKMKSLVDKQTGLNTEGTVFDKSHVSIKVISSSSPMADFFAEFPDIIRPPGLPRAVKHNTVHHIKVTPGPPVYCRPRRLHPGKL